VHDLVGKDGHIRTVPIPDWIKHTIDDWLVIAQLAHGKIFPVRLSQRNCLGNGDHGKVVWHVVMEYAERLGISKLAPHDLRRSCARFCHDSGGELEQIQFLLELFTALVSLVKLGTLASLLRSSWLLLGNKGKAASKRQPRANHREQAVEA
jgi:site-specific recombinase XerD